MGLMLLDLPTELLLEILRNLDHAQILKCSLLCRSIKKMIDNCVELQYIIELGVDEMVDCPSSALTLSQRLGMLLDRRQAWARLEWKRLEYVHMSGPCNAYELVAGVFAKTTVDPSDVQAKHFVAAWLPSRYDSGHRIEFPDVGHTTRDFSIDPLQDLIAFVTTNRNAAVPNTRNVTHIYLRSLSTNTPHPDAFVPRLDSDAPNYLNSAFIQIVDDVVGLFVRSQQVVQLQIWNWRTGVTLVLRDNDFSPRPEDFAFLSNRAYMLTCAEGIGSIEIYAFDNGSHGSTSGVSTHCASLQLPPLKSNAQLVDISTHSGPFVTRPPTGRPFTTAPESRIHYVYLEYTFPGAQGGVRFGYCVFVRNRTLMSYVSRSTFVSNVGWVEWGPDNTRFMYDSLSTEWLRYVHGQRVVLRSSHGDRPAIRLLDFNVKRRSAWLSSPSPASDVDDEVECELITSPSKVSHQKIFQSPVVTKLPYRATSRVLPNAIRYSGLMIDEERIIGLQSTAWADDSMQPLHVFVF